MSYLRESMRFVNRLVCNLKARVARKSLTIVLLTLMALACRVPSVADTVTDWNQIACNTVKAFPRLPPQTRILAMVHLAMFDSVNSVDRQYRPYQVDILAPNADAAAAAATAAHDVLVALVPAQTANLDAALAASLAQVASGPAKDAGITLGGNVAAAMIALRTGDGSGISLTFVPGSAPGQWQPTPPAFLPAVFFGWGNVMPFGIQSSTQFLPPGPPALDSSQYTSDFNEVKSLGSATSSTRTPDQTEAALFWVENSTLTWNLAARQAAIASGLSMIDNARMFALLNMAAADAIITGFEAKYIYAFWRPVTAIRNADTDGNDETEADPGWTPLSVTPAHPDYPSNHSIYSGAAARVLTRIFGNNFAFTLTTSTSPNGAVRSYDSFNQAAEECGNARILVGFHFRTAVHDGLAAGKRIGSYVLSHNLQPLEADPGAGADDDD